MVRRRILVTGSGGLIGTEVSRRFCESGDAVVGVDSNARRDFFGPMADNSENIRQLTSSFRHYTHSTLDIRNRSGLLDLMAEVRPDAVVHSAAQPSHDLAATIPFDDFETNAVGTLNLLEATRRFAPEAAFIYLSTNKVYGERPNHQPLVELEQRWDFTGPLRERGISEAMSIDDTLHSLFGASKLAGDILVQEYGRYFGMPTCVLRGGCLTGAMHRGVKLHGFLSFLVRSNLEKIPYQIIGHKGKQVRDNIDATDVARFIECYVENPRIASVYNIGGGYPNSVSILEAIGRVEVLTGIPMETHYEPQPRVGDHIVYYTDLAKIRHDFPTWDIQHGIDEILENMVRTWQSRVK